MQCGRHHHVTRDGSSPTGHGTGSRLAAGRFRPQHWSLPDVGGTIAPGRGPVSSTRLARAMGKAHPQRCPQPLLRSGNGRGNRLARRPFLERLLLRLPGHARRQVGGSAGGLGRRLDQARGEGAGRVHRLAEGGRRQHQRHAGPVHRQPAGRGDGAAARGLDGRHDLEDAGAEGEAWAEGRRIHPPGRADLREVGSAGLLARGEGGRAVGRSPVWHRPPDWPMDRRLPAAKHRRLLPAGQQAELRRPVAAGHARGDEETRAIASGQSSGGG